MTSENKKAYDRKYYHANLEKSRQTQKLYRLKNHDKILKRRQERRLTLKGLQ